MCASSVRRARGGSRLGICLFSDAMASLLDPSLPPRYGGAELQIWLLANELAKDESLDVHLMVDEIPDGAKVVPAITLHTFPKTIVRGVPGVSAIINILRWTNAIRRTRCDWYFQMSGGTLTFMVAVARVLLRKRMAFWLSTDADVDGSLLHSTPRAKRQYLWARSRADLVFAQHAGQMAGLAEQGIQAQALRSGFPIVPNTGVDTRDYVLWVASCQPLKQPELFLELARRLPDLGFVMIMTPRDVGYFERIKDDAARVANLRIIDGVPDVRPFYDRAVVLVNLSTVEGFPNTFLEAAMSATPLVSLNVDPEGMLSGGAGVVCHGDFDELVCQVASVAADPARRAALGESARRYVTDKHDIANTASFLTATISDRARRDL